VKVKRSKRQERFVAAEGHLFKVAPTVERLLLKYPKLRDACPRLAVSVWNHEIKSKFNLTLKDLTAEQFAGMIAARQLTSYESISRSWRKLQEANPELRGDEWAARQQKANTVAQMMKRDEWKATT